MPAARCRAPAPSPATSTVNGTIAPGNSIGTLNITGTYTQDAGSTYQVEVNSGGPERQDQRHRQRRDQRRHGGGAGRSAAPTSATPPTPSSPPAPACTGTYAGVTSNFAFLTPSLSYDGNDVILTLLSVGQLRSATARRRPTRQAVGAVLDTASPTATGDFNTVLNALYNLSTAQGPAALDAIGGQNYSGFSSLHDPGHAALHGQLPAPGRRRRRRRRRRAACRAAAPIRR